MDISVSLTGATDYVWRGVSQTDSDPAIFAAVSVNYEGFYAGVGTENVDFAGIDQEYDLWAGYVFDLGGASLDVGIVRYGYIDAPADIDTIDFKAALSTKVGETGLGVAAYWTPDYFGSDEDALYTELTLSQPVGEKFRVSGGVGYQQISAMPDYVTWNAGLSYTILPGVSADVRYHDTDTGAFGNNGDGRLVGSFTIGF